MSATPNRRASVAQLRDAVRLAVAESSTHQVADAIGFSQGWVRKFLAGAEPQPTTVEALQEWHVRYRRDRVAAALESLLEDFPEGSRGEVRAGLLETLRTAHRKLGTDPPGWLGC